MNDFFSKRSSSMPISPVEKLMPLADRTRQRGIRVYPLNKGQPDTESPTEVLKTAKTLKEKFIPYTAARGYLPFIESLIFYYKNIGISNLEKENFLITSGASEAIYFALMTICDENDEVIVFEPFYANYYLFSLMSKVKLIPITTYIENSFHLPSEAQIEAKIDSRVKAIIISNPSNPTGTVYSQKEIEMLGKIAQKHNLFLICDEAYREFVYDNAKTISVLQLKFLEKQIILIDTLSKRYNLCGLRLGCLISRNKLFIKNALSYAKARICAGTLDQYIATSISEVRNSYFKKIKERYETRRNLAYKEISKIPGVICKKPGGAFYILAKLPVDNSEKFSSWLLQDFSDNKETVLLAPAEGFYLTPKLGTNEVRIAYVIKERELIRAIHILRKGIEIYKKCFQKKSFSEA